MFELSTVGIIISRVTWFALAATKSIAMRRHVPVNKAVNEKSVHWHTPVGRRGMIFVVGPCSPVVKRVDRSFVGVEVVANILLVIPKSRSQSEQ